MKNPFQKSYTPQDMKIFDFLVQVPLFEKLSHEEMAVLQPFLYLRRYQQEEVVFFRKDPSQAVYIIKKGEVTLMVDMAQQFEKLNSLQAKKSFGNNALLKNAKRSYHAMVTSAEAELYVLPHVNIMDIFRSRPSIQSKMLESLSEVHNQYTAGLIQAYQTYKGFFSLAHVPINF